MFSGLTALKHLSINALDYQDFRHHLWESIASFCPGLTSIEFVGELELCSLVSPYAPILENVTDMAVEQINVDQMKTRETTAARIIDNFAPKLQRLRCTGECDISGQICATWEKFHTTQEFFKDQGRTRIRELTDPR